MTLTVWGRPNGLNVQKVMWAIGELALPHRRLDIGGPFGGNDQPAYRALNPNGTIPTIDDDGFVLWESNAIIRYLAQKRAGGGLRPADRQAAARAEQWMDWQQTVLGEPVLSIFYALIRTAPEHRDPAAIAASAGRFTILNDALADAPYLAGDDFSIADIPCGVLAYRWYNLDIERPDLGHLRAWYERLRARPAYQQHVMLPLT